MRRWVQVQDDRAHWVFEAETPPICHPDLVFIEVTEPVQEGWRFDGTRFLPPLRAAAPVTAPVAVAASEAWIPYRLTPQTPLARHEHDVPHYGIVARGTARVLVDRTEHVLEAGSIITLPAHVPHEAQAVGEEAIFISLFPDRL